jgi:hypothetical protein
MLVVGVSTLLSVVVEGAVATGVAAFIAMALGVAALLLLAEELPFFFVVGVVTSISRALSGDCCYKQIGLSLFIMC